MSDKVHLFGGDWTNEKLDVIAKYLASYTKALKYQPLKRTPFHKGIYRRICGHRVPERPRR